MLQRCDIVLVPFPFTDGPSAKPLPALVVALNERHGDVLLAFISSRLIGPLLPMNSTLRKSIRTVQ
jgi:hypothetical protein